MELILIGFTAGLALGWTIRSIRNTPKTPPPAEPNQATDCPHIWGKWELHKHGHVVGKSGEDIGFYETRRRSCELCDDFEFKTLQTKL